MHHKNHFFDNSTKMSMFDFQFKEFIMKVHAKSGNFPPHSTNSDRKSCQNGWKEPAVSAENWWQ